MYAHETVQEPIKRMIRISIITNLFDAEKRRLDASTNRLIEKHEQITRRIVDGFLYRGNWIKKTNLIGNAKSYKPMMDLSLNLEMAKHVNDISIIERDKNLIDQVIHKALTHCFTFQDVRDALPELVIDFIENVRDLQRIRQPLFFINNHRDLKDWNKILPKIEMYYGARLLY